MQEFPHTTKSLFDIAEESSENPTIFAWSIQDTIGNFNENDIIYEGNLITFAFLESSKGKMENMKKSKYVLTKEYLIRYKVAL